MDWAESAAFEAQGARPNVGAVPQRTTRSHPRWRRASPSSHVNRRANKIPYGRLLSAGPSTRPALRPEPSTIRLRQNVASLLGFREIPDKVLFTSWVHRSEIARGPPGDGMLVLERGHGTGARYSDETCFGR